MQILKLFLFFVQDKCFHYWPEVGTNCHGCMQVTLTESSFLPVYSMRTFSLIHEQVFKNHHISTLYLHHYMMNFPNNTLSDKKCRRRKWRKLCPANNSVRQKFCPKLTVFLTCQRSTLYSTLQHILRTSMREYTI